VYSVLPTSRRIVRWDRKEQPDGSFENAPVEDLFTFGVVVQVDEESGAVESVRFLAAGEETDFVEVTSDDLATNKYTFQGA
jgi:predicted Mrr-cat superfamily restriction endonuclease